MRKAGLLLVFLAPLFLPGCMTIMMQGEYINADDESKAEKYGGGYFIYSGTRRLLSDPIRLGKAGYPWIFDLPFCFALDTVILPVTISQTVTISRIIREREERALGENEVPQEERDELPNGPNYWRH